MSTFFLMIYLAQKLRTTALKKSRPHGKPPGCGRPSFGKCFGMLSILSKSKDMGPPLQEQNKPCKKATNKKGRVF
jgi:hypothetical protein